MRTKTPREPKYFLPKHATSFQYISHHTMHSILDQGSYLRILKDEKGHTLIHNLQSMQLLGISTVFSCLTCTSIRLLPLNVDIDDRVHLCKASLILQFCLKIWHQFIDFYIICNLAMPFFVFTLLDFGHGGGRRHDDESSSSLTSRRWRFLCIHTRVCYLVSTDPQPTVLRQWHRVHPIYSMSLFLCHLHCFLMTLPLLTSILPPSTPSQVQTR